MTGVLFLSFEFKLGDLLLDLDLSFELSFDDFALNG